MRALLRPTWLRLRRRFSDSGLQSFEHVVKELRKKGKLPLGAADERFVNIDSELLRDVEELDGPCFRRFEAWFRPNEAMICYLEPM